MVEELQKVIQEILERVVRMETKIDGYNDHKEKTDMAYNKSLQNEKEISEIKDNQKWLWRTFAGALIVAAMAFILKGGLIK